ILEDFARHCFQNQVPEQWNDALHRGTVENENGVAIVTGLGIADKALWLDRSEPTYQGRDGFTETVRSVQKQCLPSAKQRLPVIGIRVEVKDRLVLVAKSLKNAPVS